MSIVFGTTHAVYSADFGASRPSAFTIAGWFKMPAAPSTSVISILMHAGNSQVYPNDAGDMLMVWGTGSAASRNRASWHRTGTTYANSSAAGAGTANVWVHKVCLFDGTNGAMYENGVIVGSAVSGAITAAAPANWQITLGAENLNSSRAPAGTLGAAFGYWDIALSAQEIAGLGKGAAPYKVRPQSLRYSVLGLRNANAQIGLTASETNITFSDDNPRIYL